MKTILVTGINGFLGSHIARRLSKDFQIVGLEYSTENLYRIAGYGLDVYASNAENIANVFKNYSIDIVIHTATLYGRNNEDISQIASTNLFMHVNHRGGVPETEW